MKNKLWKDILKDTESSKYSMTKFAALIGITLLTISIIISLVIMIIKNEVDHILIGEMLGFVLTLLGYKNNFGIPKSTEVPVVDKEAINNQQILLTEQK